MDTFLSFAQNHTIIVIVLALVLLYLMYRKPKLFFGILFLGLFLAALFYMIMSIAGSGLKQEKKLIHGGERKHNTNR
jgi:4-hydroxybenzoate polyprenyltransferase